MIGIEGCANVSIKTKPGKSHGKPPKNVNLNNSKIVNKLTNSRLNIKIFLEGCKNLRSEIGAMNINDSKIPISNINRIDTIICVFP